MKSIFIVLSCVCLLASSAPLSPATPLVITPSTEPVDEYPAGQAIPTSGVPTLKQLHPMYAAWANRLIVDEYRHLHPEDTENLAFLSDACRYLWSGTREFVNQLNTRAEKLEKTNSDDPAFQLMVGIVLEDKARKEQLLRQAIAGFQGGQYSPYLLFAAASALGKSMDDRNGDIRQIAETDQIAIEALKRSLGTDSFRTDEMSVLRWRMCSQSVDSFVRRHGVEFADIFATASNLPDWIREFGQGNGYLGAAWQARTGGWAHEVTEAGWEGWRHNLAKARIHLTKAWELNPRDPAAAANMIEVAMGDKGDKQEMRRWFDRSVAAVMDYYDAYRALIWGLRPRWLGSHEEMLLFGDECLKTGRFDTCVPYQYLSIVADIASEDNRTSIYDRPAIASNCRLALEKYFETPDMPLSAIYGHTLAALLNFKAGNAAEAKTHMAAIQFRPDTGLTRIFQREYPEMMRSVLAR